MIALFSALLALAPPPPCAAVSSPYELVGATEPFTKGFAQLPFFPETLEYEVKWGIFSVGWSNLRIDRIVNFGGKPAFYVSSEARSNGFCDAFYPVRDLNESWMSAMDLSSLGYSKKLREGRFFRDEWVLYDYGAKSFSSRRTDKDGTVTLSSGTIPGPVSDILSSLYFVRARPLKIGDELRMDVNTKSNWPLVMKVLRREMIDVPAGSFKTVLVEPFLLKEGIFIQKGKKLQVWLTDDERHIPVFMRVEVAFGSVSTYLIKIGKAK